MICMNKFKSNQIKLKKNVQGPEIEPGPPAWQARILPLNHPCILFILEFLWAIFTTTCVSDNSRQNNLGLGDTTFLIRYFFRAKEMKSQNGLNWKGEINYRFNTNWCCENHFMIPYILKLISSAYNHIKTVSDETMSDTSESGYGNSPIFDNI